MHAVYALYIFACTLQLPVFITLYSVGFRTRVWLLQELPGVRVASPANRTMAVFQVAQHAADVDVGLMCAVAGLFGVLYMVLTRHSDEFLTLSDAGPPSPDSDFGLTAPPTPEEAQARLCLQALRVCFWAFVWQHGAALQAVGLRFAPPLRAGLAPLAQDLWLLTGGRLVALFVACRTPPWQRHRALAAAVCILWYAACLQAKLRTTADAPGVWVLLVLQMVVVDGLLVWTHHYDAEPTMQVIANGRLFFVACAASLVQWANALTATRIRL